MSVDWVADLTRPRSKRHAMPTRKEFDAATVLHDEAVAMYEAAKAEFEALHRAIRTTIDRGESPTAIERSEEQSARARLFVARVRLSRRQNLGD